MILYFTTKRFFFGDVQTKGGSMPAHSCNNDFGVTPSNVDKLLQGWYLWFGLLFVRNHSLTKLPDGCMDSSFSAIATGIVPTKT